MFHTREEEEIIKGNLEKVERFVRENYVPRLEKYERFSVTVLDSGNRIRYDMERDLTFGFDWEGCIWIRVGNLSLYFGKERPDSVYGNLPYAINILLNWQRAKKLVEEEFERRKKEREFMKAFEV